MRTGSEAAAFLKKSGAKNFSYAGAGSFERPWPRLKKSFCFFFFRKRSASFLTRKGLP
jgi:hypothetical protein